MIEVTKEEAKIVRKHFPYACIAKTRHKRYLEESYKYLVLLPNNVDAVAIVQAENRRKARRKNYNNAIRMNKKGN